MQRSKESTEPSATGEASAAAADARDPMADIDAGDDTAVDAGGGSAAAAGLFSPKAFALSVGLVVLGVVAGGAIPLVGSIGSLVGVFLAAFLVGLVAATRRYLEVVVAGGGVLGVQFALSVLSTGVLPVGWQFFQQYGPAFAAVGVGLGALLSALGHYFGRDLRTGLTREL
jgi:hypothetical protein